MSSMLIRIRKFSITVLLSNLQCFQISPGIFLLIQDSTQDATLHSVIITLVSFILWEFHNLFLIFCTLTFLKSTGLLPCGKSLSLGLSAVPSWLGADGALSAETIPTLVPWPSQNSISEGTWLQVTSAWITWLSDIYNISHHETDFLNFIF